MPMTLKMSLHTLQQICVPLANATAWPAIISSPAVNSHKLEYFAFYHFSPHSIFAKGVSKLGYMGQALMETYGSRIFLESNSVNFYLHPKPNCSEVTVVKTVFSRKTLPYSKERERGKKKKVTVKKVEE